jgi:dienelactone hydrolase
MAPLTWLVPITNPASHLRAAYDRIQRPVGREGDCTMLRLIVCVLAGLLLVRDAVARDGFHPETVTFPTRSSDGAAIAAYLLRPAATGRAPAIVALHGCGGLLRRDGGFVARDADWAKRLAAAGYTVLLPDSFGSRGLGSQCAVRDRRAPPRVRVGDAVGAADWLAAQPYVDPARIGLIGWSNGGSTVLWTSSGRLKPSAGDWRIAIAFYPGCRLPARSATWKPRVPVHVLIGAADDWTPAGPCRELKQRGAIELIEYAGAYHDFDAPSAPLRVRRGLAFTAEGTGEAHIGTDPKARAASIEDVSRILAAAFR